LYYSFKLVFDSTLICYFFSSSLDSFFPESSFLALGSFLSDCLMELNFDLLAEFHVFALAAAAAAAEASLSLLRLSIASS
jgi:hypothetical protein